jgi:hypothetical protein
MAPYVISTSGDKDEVQVTLVGPGIDPDGRPYVFKNTARSQKFIDAVNFAYDQGYAAGLREAERQSSRERGDEPHLLVSGRTPESLVARPESWWQRILRVWL